MNDINNALNELNFNNLNSITENGDGSEWIFLFGSVFIFVLFIVVVLFFINKNRTSGAPAPAPAPGGSPDETTRSPAGVQDLAVLQPDSGDTDLSIFLSLLGPLLLGAGISAALDIVINRLKRLTASTRTLIKNQLKALRSFKGAIRPKFTTRAAMRSAKKLLAQKISSLGLAARVRLGMVWGKTLKALGYTTEQITQILARRIGQEATEKIMEKIAIRLAARATRAAALGPVGAIDLAFAAVTLGLDLANVGGWGNIDRRQTSDLLKERSINETELKNSYIGGFKDDDGVVDPSTAVGFYPLYWGPLDEMGDTVTSDGLDVFDVMVEEKMFELLFADEPDPFIVKLLMNVAKKYGVSSTDIEQLISASMLTDMTQDDYSDLYDRAFDSICVSNGGVLVDPGVAGRAKQCSHATETACHARSPWVEGEGLVGTDDQNITYTEWRGREFFNKNYTPANVPAGVAGACIIQDPTRHEMCSSEEICMKSGTATECGKNTYIRNRGICQNTSDLCGKAGVSYCADMRQRGGSGGDCPTALDGTQADLGDYASILLPGEKLPSCYKSTGDNWAEFFLGSTIYRYFNSGAYITDTAALLTAQTGAAGVDALMTYTTGADQGLSQLSQGLGYAAEGAAAAAAAAAAPPSDYEMAAYNWALGMQDGVPYPGVPYPPGSGEAWDHPNTPKPPGVADAVLPTATTRTRTLFKNITPDCQNGDLFNSGVGQRCESCPVGSTKFSSLACLSCPAEYTLSSDGAWCYKCPANSTWMGSSQGCLVAAVLNTSIPPLQLENGSAGISGGSCPAGQTYWDREGSGQVSICLSCPAGYTVANPPMGRFCRKCPDGYILSDDTSVCLLAPN